MDLKDKWRNLLLAQARSEYSKGSDNSDTDDTPHKAKRAAEANAQREAEEKEKAKQAAKEEATRAAIARMKREAEEKERKRVMAASSISTKILTKPKTSAFSRAAPDLFSAAPAPPAARNAAQMSDASIGRLSAKRHLGGAFQSTSFPRFNVARCDEEDANLSGCLENRQWKRIRPARSDSDEESDYGES